MEPGGAPETYALELHQAMLQSEGLEPVLVGRTAAGRHRAGSAFSALDGDPSQYLVRIEDGGFDILNMTYGEKSLYTRFFADFLRALDPDVVHLQHTLFVGCELVSLVRRLLPSTPIVYTLHDYMPICNRDGRLVRTDETLCLEATPRRCHECFPGISEQTFFLRERFIRAHLDQVHLFLAPSHFLLERYVDWGIPREKIRFEECGRPPALPPAESGGDRPRNRLGLLRRPDPRRLRGRRDPPAGHGNRARAGTRRSPVAARHEFREVPGCAPTAGLEPDPRNGERFVRGELGPLRALRR